MSPSCLVCIVYRSPGCLLPVSWISADPLACPRVARRVKTLLSCPLPVSLPLLAPKPSSLRRVMAPPVDSAASFSGFESLSPSAAHSKALWNHFGSDLGTILGPFWELKSIIKPSLIAFEVVYTRSPFLNDIINDLDDFCFRGGFETR